MTHHDSSQGPVAEKARTEVRGREEILSGCLSGLQRDVIKTINSPDTCSTAVCHSHKPSTAIFPPHWPQFVKKDSVHVRTSPHNCEWSTCEEDA